MSEMGQPRKLPSRPICQLPPAADIPPQCLPPLSADKDFFNNSYQAKNDLAGTTAALR